MVNFTIWTNQFSVELMDGVRMSYEPTEFVSIRKKSMKNYMLAFWMPVYPQKLFSFSFYITVY